VRRRACFVFLVLLAGLALFSRQPDRLLHPELWAEDGVVWIGDAYNHGLSSLWMVHSGYLQTLSRLGGLLSLALPMTDVPLAFALLAFAVQLAPAVLLLSPRGETLLPSTPARLLLALYYIGLPNSAETYVNLTNAMWHLAVLALLIIVLPKPAGKAGYAADICALVLAGLSGPFALFLAPIACVHAWAGRRGSEAKAQIAYAAIISLCAVVQGISIHLYAGAQRLPNLGRNFVRLAHILANQIFLGGVAGAFYVQDLMAQSWWNAAWPAVLVCALGLVLAAVAFWRGPAAYRYLVVLAVLVLAGGLASPVVSISGSPWGQMAVPGIGGRYMMIGMLAWFAGFLVLAGQKPWGWKWLGRALVVASGVGIAGDWVVLPYVPTGFQAAARSFDASRAGTPPMFPENPPGWQFFLVK
jgi:hypothetical protein